MDGKQAVQAWIPRDQYRKLKAATNRELAKEAARAHKIDMQQKELLEKWSIARTKVILGTLAQMYRFPNALLPLLPPANSSQNYSAPGACGRCLLAIQAADEGKVLRPTIMMRDGIVETATLGLFLDALNAGKWSNESYAGRFGATYPRGCADALPTKQPLRTINVLV